jgi:3',5'-cyclic AMP phosphodiesterase CpdA
MVNNKVIPSILLVFSLVFTTCENDFYGIFGAADPLERFQYADDFPYLESHLYPNGQSWKTIQMNGASPYSFLFLTDTHLDASNSEKFSLIQNSFIPSDKFVVVGGDITTADGIYGMDEFMSITEKWPLPCYPVLGNHDIYFRNWQHWREVIGSTRYRIDSDDGLLSVIVLDSANDYFSEQQLDWLEIQLKTASDTIFVFSHMALFASDGSFTSAEPLERARLISLFTTYNVTAYFSGHIHQTIIHKIKDCLYLAMEDFKSNYSYIRVFVNPDGSIHYEFCTVPG